MNPETLVAAFAKGMMQACLEYEPEVAKKSKPKKVQSDEVRQTVMSVIADLVPPIREQPAPTTQELDDMVRRQSSDGRRNLDEEDIDAPESPMYGAFGGG
jgi:hypothetical protein